MIEINENSEIMYEDQIAASAHWSMTIRKGVTLRLIDSLGGANVGMLLYNPKNKLERYNDQELEKKYARQRYQESRNDWTLSGEHCFLVELAKHELNERDISANLNLFSKVVADDNGTLSFEPDNSKAGDFIDLRFEIDCLVILNTAPHPMNPSPEYPRKPISYQLRKTPPILADDECLNSCEENKRGIKNNQLYNLTGDYS